MADNARRKPTKQETREARLKRVRRLNQQQNVEQHYDNLHGLYSDCSSSLENVLPVAEIIRNAELLATLPTEAQTQIRVRAKTILEDLKEYRNTLNAIYDKHKHLRGTESNTFKVIGTFQIAEEYIQWQDSYDNVVSAAIGDFLAYCEEVFTPIHTCRLRETT